MHQTARSLAKKVLVKDNDDHHEDKSRPLAFIDLLSGKCSPHADFHTLIFIQLLEWSIPHAAESFRSGESSILFRLLLLIVFTVFLPLPRKK